MSNCTKESSVRPILEFLLTNINKINPNINCVNNKLFIKVLNYAIYIIFFLIFILAISIIILLIYKCVKRLEKKPEDEKDNKQEKKMDTLRESNNIVNDISNQQEKNNTTKTESIDKGRLEMMEFYKRLIINQILKREKLEESSVEKVGNFLRSGVNFLFGDPRRGLDLTDPQIMFHPYWPERNDYSLLTAYSALNDHIINKRINSAPKFQTSINNSVDKAYLPGVRMENDKYEMFKN